ncbi:hypothetical protein HKBW3S44_00112 [Candidatus Hakubella thermalkaliphila]|uniref:DUF1385 domain-containing protein n=2 Tax=Candidatus Hakubella thermalkaliphila TaxID=2754717 RepID=A0A6V8Q2Q7_9ACTN|nr:DUF1385 domain-containing protein [Candidatus Hakubella thermalkaliphila]GFP36429.1 hypothetical protein HKBW3S44_00112 [Candidatus Hakubella thermalkaliphila]GFP38720.1 hypothetical protein HKBW3S47_00421 [Candidatus Hakubella thermalkaliphila]
MGKRSLIGGQAVIEGVMMRGSDRWAVAVRKPDLQMDISAWPFSSLTKRIPQLRIAIVRGILVLFESLVIGLKAISYSADVAAGEEVRLSKRDVTLAMIMALALAVGLFFVLPTVVARSLDRLFPSTLVYNLAEGALRIAILVGYIVFISSLKEIRRVFQYHGAEHKVINAFENGEDLTVEAARKHSRIHLRCGTSFLLVVMVVSILVFSFLGRPDLVTRILSRIVVIPLVAGISYEIVRFAGKHRTSRLLHALLYPGLLLQSLTTGEPSDDQIEVALAALKKVIE